MDAQVARLEDAGLKRLLEKFVCVRVVQMRGADLSLFQFDWDQTWAAMFLNGDRTIYGRYGTRTAGRKDAMRDISLDGLKKALEGALEVHAAYPGNRASLAGKTGAAPAAPSPEKLPDLQGGRFEEKLPRGCIHCHDVYEGVRGSFRRAKKPLPDEWMYPYPAPDVVGLSLDTGERARVKSVEKGSAAEKAGFRAGDRIATLAGQPILSIADVQWVLQGAPASGDLEAEVLRGKDTVALALRLDEGWRRHDVSWRESTWPLRPGFRVDPLAADERAKEGLGPNVLALKVGGFVAPNREGAKAGIRPNDLVVAIDGKTDPMTETEFLAYLWQKRQRGEAVTLKVVHGRKRQDLKLSAP